MLVFWGLLIVIIAGLLWRAKLRFHFAIMDGKLLFSGRAYFFFQLIRIPLWYEAPLDRFIRRLISNMGKHKDKTKYDRFKKLIIKFARECGNISELECRGRVGVENDAFKSVFAAGALQIALCALAGALFDAEPDVHIKPNFERPSFWINMEGIIEIVITQIITNEIRKRGIFQWRTR